MNIQNFFARLLAVLAAVVLCAYFLFLGNGVSALQGEGVIRYLWIVLLAAWVIGVGYLFVGVFLAMGWIYGAALNGIADATANWPEPLRRLIGAPKKRSEN